MARCSRTSRTCICSSGWRLWRGAKGAERLSLAGLVGNVRVRRFLIFRRFRLLDGWLLSGWLLRGHPFLRRLWFRQLHLLRRLSFGGFRLLQPALLLGKGDDFLAHGAAEPARLRFHVGRKFLRSGFFSHQNRGNRRVARRRLLSGRGLAGVLGIRIERKQLLLSAAREIRHRHVGDHAAAAAAEADLLVLGGTALVVGAQPPAHHHCLVVEGKPLLAAGLRIEPGLAQGGDDAGDDFVVHARKRAPLALQDWVIDTLTIHSRAETAVNRPVSYTHLTL